MTLTEIGALIRDDPGDHGTREPLFLVQTRERLYGMDPGYGGKTVWLHCDGDEASATEAKEFDAMGCAPPDWTHTGYLDQWEFVTVCLTREGAEAFIRANGHNLCDPRVYVDTAYRNHEIIDLRRGLVALAVLP